MPKDPAELGSTLRQLRISQKMTLELTAKQVGVTRSYLSQVELGKTNPSLATLKRIAGVLGASIADLFNHEHPEPVAERPAGTVRIVRNGHHKGLTFPGSQGNYKLLTADLQGKIEFILVTAEPGTSSGDDDFEHTGEECCYVLRGTMELRVGGTVYILGAGDSATFESHIPHRWINVGEEPMEVFWVITPPSF